MRLKLFVLTCLTAASVSAQTSPVAAPPAAPPSIADFAQLPFLESPKVSPDGTHIAARLAINGVQQLAIVPINGVGKIALIRPGELDINGWFWVNDEWLVARVGIYKPVEGGSWYLRRTMGIRADGKKIVPIGLKGAAQNADDILWIARDGSPRILLALQTSIYANQPGFWPEVREFDVSTGKGKRVLAPTENVLDWYADAAGTVRLGIGYNDERRAWRTLYRDRPGQLFRTIDRARGRNAALGNVPALFLAEPGKALTYDDSDGYDALYNYDLATLKTGEKLFGVPGYDLDGLISDPSGTRLMGVRYSDTRPRTHWFDPALATAQAKVDKAAGDRTAQIVSWSRDFSVMVVLLGGADRPGAYYLYRPAKHSLDYFGAINETFDEMQSASPVSTIHYKARDGLDISAVLTTPKGRLPKNLPLILMPHGGPAVRDDEQWDWWAQFLASRGYAVLQPNYRGSTGFGTAFVDKGKGQWGLAMQDDLTDAVKWAASSGLADAKRVCIVGGSYGGYAALRAAQRDTGVYRCAVSYAGVSDMPAMLRYDGKFLNGTRAKDYLLDQAPDLRSVSPINFAADFSIPVLLVHGKADTVVPVRHSREMAERLKAAGKPFRYVEQPKGDHHFSEEADRVQFLTELEAFLKEHNPA